MRKVLALIAILAVGGFAIMQIEKGTPNAVTTGETRQADPKTIAIKEVDLKYEWGKAADGLVMLADFTFRNNNDFAVKDLTITCNHYASSGTLVDSNTRTVYELIRPKTAKTVRGFNMGFIHSQAARSGCKIVDLVAEADPATATRK